MKPDVLKLVEAGPIASVARVGHAPFDQDDPIEFTFANGAVIHIDVGLTGASDIEVHAAPLLEHAYGHLRGEEPATWAAIARDWTREAIDLPWLIGATLANPRRLAITEPFRLDVGYVFDAGGHELALFAESDLIFLTALDDPSIASFQLEIGAPIV